MVTYRRYLIASSLARLVRKERGGNRVTEGHFPNQADRSSFVVVEGDKGSLVLLHYGPNGPIEERTEVPRAHAEALLDVTPGKLDYLLTHLTVGTRDIQILRFVTPGPLDLISVPFESDEEARDFRPLSWFGQDVTTEVIYQNRSIALEGAPQAPDVPMSKRRSTACSIRSRTAMRLLAATLPPGPKPEQGSSAISRRPPRSSARRAGSACPAWRPVPARRSGRCRSGRR